MQRQQFQNLMTPEVKPKQKTCHSFTFVANCDFSLRFFDTHDARCSRKKMRPTKTKQKIVGDRTLL